MESRIEQPIIEQAIERRAEHPVEQQLFWQELGHAPTVVDPVAAELAVLRREISELKIAQRGGELPLPVKETVELPVQTGPAAVLQEKTMKRRKAKVERLASEVRNPDLVRHLFLSDTQAPDFNVQAIRVVKQFMADFAPDNLHLVGDMVNFTKAGTYSVDQRYDVGLEEEVRIGRELIRDLVETARAANPKVVVNWYEGNHEYRIQRYLARLAPEIRNLTDKNGDPYVSVPNLFGLDELGVNWIPYYESHHEGGDVEVEHGDIARSKSGYTAHGMIDRRGSNGFSGHTHKLALVSRNQGGDVKYWVETGSLCNPEPNPKWTKKPDWVNGFAVGIYDKKQDIMHPTPVLMQGNSFAFGGKVYK